MSGRPERPVHAYFGTQGLPRPWEEANDGRWIHVGYGDDFAHTIERITCAHCRSYIERDREALRGNQSGDAS